MVFETSSKSSKSGKFLLKFEKQNSDDNAVDNNNNDKSTTKQRLNDENHGVPLSPLMLTEIWRSCSDATGRRTATAAMQRPCVATAATVGIATSEVHRTKIIPGDGWHLVTDRQELISLADGRTGRPRGWSGGSVPLTNSCPELMHHHSTGCSNRCSMRMGDRWSSKRCSSWSNGSVVCLCSCPCFWWCCCLCLMRLLPLLLMLAIGRRGSSRDRSRVSGGAAAVASATGAAARAATSAAAVVLASKTAPQKYWIYFRKCQSNFVCKARSNEGL